MKNIQQRVFIFDSGIGGLTVLAECKRLNPNFEFYYYGDNVNAPYGNYSKETITRLTKNIFERYAFLRPNFAVIACNTVTAICAEELRTKYSYSIIGTEPAVLPVAKKGGEIYVLTTRATYACMRFQQLCKNIKNTYPNARLKLFSCDCLAGEIERNILNKNYDYTSFLPPGHPDYVVLGCTHYIYAKAQIEAYYGCPSYNGNLGVAKRLKSLFNEQYRDDQPLSTPAQTQLINPSIYFLGDSAVYNQRVYEQMFAKTGVFCNKSG